MRVGSIRKVMTDARRFRRGDHRPLLIAEKMPRSGPEPAPLPGQPRLSSTAGRGEQDVQGRWRGTAFRAAGRPRTPATYKARWYQSGRAAVADRRFTGASGVGETGAEGVKRQSHSGM